MATSTLNRGWIVVFAGFGINLALGVLYSWSIFAKRFTEEWGWSSGTSSLPYAVAVAFFAAVLAFGGRAQDRFGPRLVATIGASFTGVGLLVSSLSTAENPLPVTLGFGVLTGSGIALGFVSTFPAAAKWFPAKRRGLVTGVVVSGFGIASVYIAPLTEYLLRSVGIRATFLALGVGFLVATVSLAQLVRNPPLGFPGPVMPLIADDDSAVHAPPVREFTWRELVRTRQFVQLWLMYGLTAFAGIMVIGHMAKITQAQLGVDLGFLLVAILAVGNAAGRIGAGVVADRLGSARTMTLVFTAQAVVLALTGFADTVALLSAAAFLIGFNYGADLSLFPLIITKYFGQANQGVNYGVVFTSWGVGGVFGSMAAGAIVDATGSYLPAFALAAGLCAVAAAITLFVREPVTPGNGPHARAPHSQRS